MITVRRKGRTGCKWDRVMIDRAKTIKERRRVCLDGHYGSGSLTETPSIENLEIYCEMIRKKASLETVLEGAKLIKRYAFKLMYVDGSLQAAILTIHEW